MRILSVQQPWAWAILHAGKDVENRTWATDYRGPVLIHAGLSRGRLGDYGPGEPPREKLVFGAILGVVDLVDCCHFDDLSREWRESRWTECGGYCWLLANPRPFAEPLPHKGQRGLYAPPAGLILPPDLVLVRA